MSSVLMQIKDYLAARNATFVEEQNETLVVPVRGQSCTFQLRVSMDESAQQIALAAWASVLVPDGARRAVAETACRVNSGLRAGRCEFDFDSGYLGFYVSQFVHDELHQETLDELFQLSAWTLDLFVSASLSVVYGNELPVDAVRAAKIAAGVISADGEDNDDEAEAESE